MTTVTKEIRQTICEQIGFRTVLSISGGRVHPIDQGVSLPVSNGYFVRVEYDEGWDDYTVTRVFIRGGKEFIKGRREHVYCGELSEVAYRAGMFRSYGEEEW